MKKLLKLIGWGLALINKILPNPPQSSASIYIHKLKYTADEARNLFRLVEDATCRIGEFCHTLKRGFEWDGASIPNWAWLIVGTPFEPRFMAASALHDDMYRQGLDRADADLYFYWILLESGVDQKTAEKMYYAVKIGGWKPYNKYLKENKGQI